MVATSTSDDARSIFEAALMSAITDGQIPSCAIDVDERTRAAIEAIALAHPEAAVELIAVAFDSFQAENNIAA